MTNRRAKRRERCFQFAFAVDRIQRHDDAARFPDAVLRHHELRAIGKEQRDPVAGTNADRRQGRREGIASAGSSSGTRSTSLEQQRRRVSLVAREIRQVVEQRPIRVGDKRGSDVGVVMRQPRLHHGILREQGEEECFLGVQAVFRLVEDD